MLRLLRRFDLYLLLCLFSFLDFIEIKIVHNIFIRDNHKGFNYKIDFGFGAKLRGLVLFASGVLNR